MTGLASRPTPQLFFSQTMFVKQTLALLAVAVSINFVGLLGAPVWAQEVGDRVVVTANYDTKFKSDIVGRVFEGDIYTLKERNGRWCQLDRIEGWLPTQNIMSLESGLQHFSNRIEDNEKDEIAFAHRGMIFHELEDYKNAINDLNNSLGLNKNNPVTWMHRGMVLKAQNRNKLAAEDMTHAIKLIEDKNKRPTRAKKNPDDEDDPVADPDTDDTAANVQTRP